MKTHAFFTRAALGVAGGALMVGAAGVAIADEVTSDDVDVSVTIEAVDPVGELTMSVAPGSAILTEVDPGDDGIRQFNGTLPTVTVTDDRDEVPSDAWWYVVGQATALSSGANSIGAEYLGWTPQLLTTEGDGEVTEGPQVDTILDGGPNAVGLVGEEFLSLAVTSTDAAAVGEWSANADLFLKTPADVAPGAYSGTITLTLWEDAF